MATEEIESGSENSPKNIVNPVNPVNPKFKKTITTGMHLELYKDKEGQWYDIDITNKKEIEDGAKVAGVAGTINLLVMLRFFQHAFQKAYGVPALLALLLDIPLLIIDAHRLDKSPAPFKVKLLQSILRLIPFYLISTAMLTSAIIPLMLGWLVNYWSWFSYVLKGCSVVAPYAGPLFILAMAVPLTLQTVEFGLAFYDYFKPANSANRTKQRQLTLARQGTQLAANTLFTGGLFTLLASMGFLKIIGIALPILLHLALPQLIPITIGLGITLIVTKIVIDKIFDAVDAHYQKEIALTALNKNVDPYLLISIPENTDRSSFKVIEIEAAYKQAVSGNKNDEETLTQIHRAYELITKNQYFSVLFRIKQKLTDDPNFNAYTLLEIDQNCSLKPKSLKMVYEKKIKEVNDKEAQKDDIELAYKIISNPDYLKYYDELKSTTNEIKITHSNSDNLLEVSSKGVSLKPSSSGAFLPVQQPSTENYGLNSPRGAVGSNINNRTEFKLEDGATRDNDAAFFDQHDKYEDNESSKSSSDSSETEKVNNDNTPYIAFIREKLSFFSCFNKPNTDEKETSEQVLVDNRSRVSNSSGRTGSE